MELIRNIIYKVLPASAAIVFAGLVSCAKNDANDYNFTLITDLGVVSYVDENGYFEIIRDYINKTDEAVLVVYRNEYPDHKVTLGERVFITYSIDREISGSESFTPTEGKVYRINLTDFNSLLSKPILMQSDLLADQELRDEVGYDRISANRAWVFDTWLNIEFSYLRYNTDVYHIVNLVWDDTAQTEEGVIRLLFRHNAMGETPSPGIRMVEKSGMASFPLGQIASESVVLEIYCEYYDSSLNPIEWTTHINYTVAGDAQQAQKNAGSGNNYEYYLGPPVNTTTFVR